MRERARFRLSRSHLATRGSAFTLRASSRTWRRISCVGERVCGCEVRNVRALVVVIENQCISAPPPPCLLSPSHLRPLELALGLFDGPGQLIDLALALVGGGEAGVGGRHCRFFFLVSADDAKMRTGPTLSLRLRFFFVLLTRPIHGRTRPPRPPPAPHYAGLLAWAALRTSLESSPPFTRQDDGRAAGRGAGRDGRAAAAGRPRARPPPSSRSLCLCRRRREAHVRRAHRQRHRLLLVSLMRLVVLTAHARAPPPFAFRLLSLISFLSPSLPPPLFSPLATTPPTASPAPSTRPTPSSPPS